MVEIGADFPHCVSSLEEGVGADSNIEMSPQRNSNEMLIFNPNLLSLATVSRSRIRLREIFKIHKILKYSGCSGHRAVFYSEGGEPGPGGRKLLLQVQQWSCFNTLAGGNY